MKTFFVLYKTGKEEIIKANSMHISSGAVQFRVGKDLKAVVPFSAIERAADSKNVSEKNIESEKSEKNRIEAAKELRELMKTGTAPEEN
jgi:hypothetical protein